MVAQTEAGMFRTILVPFALALSAAAPAAAATTVCYPRDEMLSLISRDYAATKQAAGIVRPYSVMEVWVSERDGDWLIVTTDLDGSSCIVAYGEDFSLVAGRMAAETDSEG
jgi:hypothetical protein